MLDEVKRKFGLISSQVALISWQDILVARLVTTMNNIKYLINSTPINFKFLNK